MPVKIELHVLDIRVEIHEKTIASTYRFSYRASSERTSSRKHKQVNSLEYRRASSRKLPIPKMCAGVSGSYSSVLLRATLRTSSEANARTLSANSIPVLHSRRRLSTALLSNPTTTTSRRRVIGSSVTGAPSEACAIRTGRTQSSLPHQATSCLPTKSSRAFTSGTKSLFRSSQQLYLPPKTNSGIMSLQKETLQPGDGATYPKEGDTVVMEYTGEY